MLELTVNKQIHSRRIRLLQYGKHDLHRRAPRVSGVFQGARRSDGSAPGTSSRLPSIGVGNRRRSNQLGTAVFVPNVSTHPISFYDVIVHTYNEIKAAKEPPSYKSY